jgi:hypothetical protein
MSSATRRPRSTPGPQRLDLLLRRTLHIPPGLASLQEVGRCVCGWLLVTAVSPPFWHEHGTMLTATRSAHGSEGWLCGILTL